MERSGIEFGHGVLFVVSQNREVNERLGKIKRGNFSPKMATATSYVSKEQPSIADDPDLKNAFYDAPTVITMFAPKNFLFAVEDCAVAAENMMLADGRVQILGYTRYKEMIRLSARAVPAKDEEQKMWIDTIFSEQPYLSNVYPGNTRNIGIVFEIKDAMIEYFRLGVNPIFREVYVIGNGTAREKGYQITEDCIGCGKCARNCPQRCIEEGQPFVIRQEHCLHCGNCYENCPVKAVRKRG